MGTRKLAELILDAEDYAEEMEDNSEKLKKRVQKAGQNVDELRRELTHIERAAVDLFGMAAKMKESVKRAKREQYEDEDE